MPILDLDDPADAEYQRQLEYDRRCGLFPRCCECGGSVYPYETFTEIGDFIFCQRCVKDGTKLTENLEV